ncbi:unnamed protein product [Phytophthora fragariaefolia]|uniref:Unnamed protein product n=1 Tax=Phytophthora fragariaefolia TaxID=1490495 RepID=A0A9W7DAS6_9STRA|nr:unnamed protein product [Phytophthora fragariaefolia]
MKFSLPDGAFPTVRLSKSHQDALVVEAETVVSETIAANEAFRAQGAALNSAKWRLVRVKEGLHVYCRRPTSESAKAADEDRGTEAWPPQPHARTWTADRSTRHRGHVGSSKRLEATVVEPLSPSSVAAESSIQEQMRRPGVSLMVLHGIVEGTLDDSMFGAFAATDHAWKWRSSHMNDRLDDARILGTIRGPTRQDPFRFLGIKWFVKEHPAVLTGILQRRDFLILEATGLTQDSKGEKVGYFLMHSVTLRAAPELTEMNIIRGELSFCFILRQSGHGKVNLYCRGFTDPRGNMMERVSVAIAAEALICAAGVVDYANIKKLTWLMKHKTSDMMARQRQSGRDATHSGRCESCNKSFTKFALIAVAAGTAAAGKGAACQICRRVVCAKCSVVKKMTVDVSNSGAVKQCALRFCLGCLLEAKEQSAWEMALNTFETGPESSSIPRVGSTAATPPPSVPHTSIKHQRHGRTYSEYQRNAYVPVFID